MEQVLHIKNMVCDRCIKVVKEELEGLDLQVSHIKLGEATVQAEQIPDIQAIKDVLEKNGFELLESRKVQIIDRIKTLIIELIHQNKLEGFHLNFSDYLSNELAKDYSYLSNLFSSVENITIEKYIILQKIERVKELLVYDELSLSEIAYELGYSNVAHLSSQFKQTTGLTPTAFKKLKNRPRAALDKVSGT